MKTLAQRNSVYELVIVVKRGICTELIWVSDKALVNRLSSIVYDKQMSFMDQLDKTYLIELLPVDCKKLGLKRDCTSETFMFNTNKMKDWLETHIEEEKLFDIKAIIDAAEFQPRTIVLASHNGRDCLIKLTRKLSEKIWKPFIDAGYMFQVSCNFTSNEALRLFSFMVPSTKSNIVDYEIGPTTVKRFKSLLESQGIELAK